MVKHDVARRDTSRVKATRVVKEKKKQSSFNKVHCDIYNIFLGGPHCCKLHRFTFSCFTWTLISVFPSEGSKDQTSWVKHREVFHNQALLGKQTVIRCRKEEEEELSSSFISVFPRMCCVVLYNHWFIIVQSEKLTHYSRRCKYPTEADCRCVFCIFD